MVVADGDLLVREGIASLLAMMAEGRPNSGIERALWVTESAAEKHVHHILTKARLSDSGDGHHRVLALAPFLEARSRSAVHRRAVPGSFPPTGMTSAGTRVPDSL
ncbi:MAG TPA: hypothetical protein VFW65_05380 [Pseudonocardiaceae bacterium]|nr:hypothetical protein [Pseudonocardiaceae bacterium]